MDSLYEIPRSVPVPVSAEKIMVMPMVPEASMVVQESTRSGDNYPFNDEKYLTYNAWKACRNNADTIETKQNYQLNLPQHAEPKTTLNCGNVRNVIPRQVRFGSSATQQQPKESITAVSNSSDSNMDGYFGEKFNASATNGNRFQSTKQFMRPFEEIYMANVPNRHLDLSIIDPPKLDRYKENLENINPNINKGVTSGTVKYDRNFKYGDSGNHLDLLNKQRINTPRSASKDRFDKCFLQNANTKASSENIFQKNNLIYSEQMKNLDVSGITQKDKVVDMYNYNRGNLQSNLGNASHQVLDNTKQVINNKLIRNSKTEYVCGNLSNKTSFSCSCDGVICKCTCKCSTANGLKVAAVCQKQCKDLATVNANQEPTVKDLLKIIQQQNDQLINLQKQVASLLDDKKHSTEPPSLLPKTNQYQTSTQLETKGNFDNPLQNFNQRKGPLQQFSMDVMTSFEVSIRPQNRHKIQKNVHNFEPKITEVTETDSDAFDSNLSEGNGVANILDDIRNQIRTTDEDTLKNTDVSLTFNEPVHVQEPCPSPVNSIEIHMNDYSYDSDQEDTAEAGWTFCNIMQQVNKVLKKAGIQPNDNAPLNFENAPCNNGKQDMMRTVKEATIKHLRNIGVHVSASVGDDSIEIQQCDQINYNPKEINFAVQQLLMKYMPDEQLAKFKVKDGENAVQLQKPGFIKRRPEFSFATVKYMEKYKLLRDLPSNARKAENIQVVTRQHQNENFNRILDVTAIKQQPKLL